MSGVIWNNASASEDAFSLVATWVSNVLVNGYPTFDPTHQYTVSVNLGAMAPQRLYFAFGDGGCSDNSGSWTLKITPGNCPL